jgi:hypothetical protein
MKKAKIITALGMMYDMENPNDFVAGVAKVLHPQGIFIAQLMCLKQTLEKGDVGNFAHEHLEFYSLRSLERLFSEHGLYIQDIEENNVNGGSYRLYVRTRGCDCVPTQRVEKAFDEEDDLGLADPATYATFVQRIERNREEVRSFLESAERMNKMVWIYGASTKGNVLLQYWGVNRRWVQGAVDKSPEKWSKWTVGTNIPIKGESLFRLARPDYALILPYAFEEEFVSKEREWLEAGGTFVVPLPYFHYRTFKGKQ